MMEVHRQSGGFTPPAQLNVFDFLFNRGGMPIRSYLAMAGGRRLFHWGLPRGILASSALGVEMPVSVCNASI